MGSTPNRVFLRQLEPGDDGLDPSGELAYGLEYLVEFKDGAARRYQAVMTRTALASDPIRDPDPDEAKTRARRFLEATVGYFLDETARAETPEELDDAMEALGNFRLVRDEPQNKYKLWQLVVRLPGEEPR